MGNFLLNLIGQFGGVDAVIGLIAPLILAFIYKEHWSTKIKTNATWMAALITGIATIGLAGGLKGDWSDIGTVLFNFGVILVAATQAHDKFYKPTGITPALEKLKLPALNTGTPAPANINVTTPLDGDALKDAAKDIAQQAASLAVAAIAEKYLPKQPIAPSVAGIPGAVPSEPQAQLGGATVPADPVTTTAYAAAVAPTITPAPSVQAQTAAVTNAIANGTPVEKVVDPYEPVAG
jgi:hypothetical protein